jgi:acylphosphatase
VAGGGVTSARHVRVSGRVQGVFYRAWTAEQARGLGVAGWVRNCPDGSVEALLEGTAEAVAILVERMRDGPPAARVGDVAVEPATPTGASGFAVRH